eukprot:COSAG05_NODE_15306_length_373_cov_0.551095_1_plen_39_part_10
MTPPFARGWVIIGAPAAAATSMAANAESVQSDDDGEGAI